MHCYRKGPILTLLLVGLAVVALGCDDDSESDYRSRRRRRADRKSSSAAKKTSNNQRIRQLLELREKEETKIRIAKIQIRDHQRLNRYSEESGNFVRISDAHSHAAIAKARRNIEKIDAALKSLNAQ